MKLYVVATPIGNLQDLSPRALETLRGADLIAAEDTRRSLGLLNHFGIRKPLVSYHEHNERSRAAELVRRMLDEGLDIALITDAGTPAISDPGALLVRAAAEAGVEVVAVPGPSAAIAALSVSGFETASFTFLGFPPRGERERAELLTSLRGRGGCAVFHESPHRVEALLESLIGCLGDLLVSLSCDLSKLHEKTLRGPASRVLAAFRDNEKAEKGEYVLVADLSGCAAAPAAQGPPLSLEARLFDLLLQGQDLRTAMAALQEAGERKNAVYAASLRLKAIIQEKYRQ